MITLFLSFFLLGGNMFGQVTLLTGTTSYTQNFDGIGAGLPAGWTIQGQDVPWNAAQTSWTFATSSARNFASFNSGLPFNAPMADQHASTDRALGIRQTANNSDAAGTGFQFAIANTVGFVNFSLDFEMQSLDGREAVGRTVTWIVRYSTNNGTTWNTATTLPATITTGGPVAEVTFASTPVNVEFGNALDNVTSNVLIQIVTAASTGTGSRPISAIDNFVLTFEEATQVAMPTFSPAGGNVFAPVNVEIASATPGATIHFTTEDRDPTTTDPVFIAGTPIVVNSTTTIRAMAVHAGMTNSTVAKVTYTFPTTVANIAEFLALPEGTAAQITGTMSVVTQQGSNVFVQDASGWLWINYPSPTNTYDNGYQITGVIGTRAIIGGAPRLNTVASIGLPAGTPGAAVTPSIVTPESLVNTDINRYVAFENVEIAYDIVFLTTGTIQNGFIVTNSTMIIRNAYQLIAGGFVAGDIVNVRGIVSVFNYELQLNLLSIEVVSGSNMDVIAHWGGFTATPDNGIFLATAGITPNNGIAELTRGEGQNGANWGFGGATANPWHGFATSGTWANPTIAESYWIATFSTTGYENLIVSSAQRSTGTAPANFRLEYRVGDGGWNPVAGGDITLIGTTDITTLADLPLPAAMNNQAEVSLRWIVSGTNNVNGAALTAGIATATNSIRITVFGEENPLLGVNVPERNVNNRVVYSTGGHVHFIATAGEVVQIHNVLGQLIYQGIAAEGTNSVAVSPGIVLVRVGNTVNKVVVR